MACQIHPERFLDLVKTLLRIDAQKYAQFDEVVAFVLRGKQSGLSQEAQVLALAHLAHIYQELALTDDRYQAGQASAVISLENESDQFDAYLEQIAGLYPRLQVLEPARPLTLASHVQPALNELASRVEDQQLVVASDVQHVLERLNQVLLPTPDLAERERLAEPVHQVLTQVLAQLGSPEALVRPLHEHQAALSAYRSYLPLSEALAAAKLPTHLGRTSTGERVELRQNEQGEFLLPTGELAENLAGTPALANPTGWGLENRGQNVFFVSELGSALTAKAFSSQEQAALEAELTSLGIDLNVRLTVRAQPLEEFTDARVDALHELAATDPAYAGLVKREHETFENEAQQQRLRQGEQQVLTVRRPTRSLDSFQLIATLPSGREFLLYSPRTFTLVGSDNSTRALDLTRDEDLALVQQLSVVRTPYAGHNVDAQLDPNQLEQLRRSAELYDRFEAAVLAQEEEDVTELFRQHYLFARETPVQTLVPLDEFMQAKGEEVSKTVQVVRLDAEGQVDETSRQTRALPVVFTRFKDQPFQPIAPLSPGEFIAHEGNYYSYEQYLRQVLGLDHDQLIDAYLSPAQKKNVWGLLVYFSKYGDNKFMLVEPRRVLSQVGDLAEFLTALQLQRTLPERNRNAGENSWSEFGRQRYGFKLRSHGIVLNFNAERRPQPGEPARLALELRADPKLPTSPALRLLRDKLLEWKLNFYLDNASLQDIYGRLFTPELVSQLKAALPGLSTSKFEQRKLERDPALLSEFYQSAVTLLGSDRTSRLAQDLQVLSRELEQAFGELLKSQVTDRVVETIRRKAADPQSSLTSEAQRQIEQALQEAFTNPLTGEDTSFLLATEFEATQPEEGEEQVRHYFPTITYPKGSANPRRLDQYHAVTALPRGQGVQLRPASPASLGRTVKSVPLTPAAPELAEAALPDATSTPTPPVEGNPASPNPVGKLRSLKKQADFSLSERLTQGISREQQAQQEAQVRAMLPQLGISEEDISEFFDLSRFGGHVNGAYVNRLIYLNRTLGAADGTVYHEAWHGFTRDVLHAPQAQALFDQIKNMSRYRQRFTPAALAQFARERRQVLDSRTADRVADEILADDFRDRLLGRQRTQTRGLVGKFLDLLARLFQLGDAWHQRQLDEVYDQVSAGYYAQAGLNSATDQVLPGEVALELIPGVERVSTNPETGEDELGQAQVTVGEQQQLVLKLTRQVLLDERPGVSFDEKFDEHRRSLYQERFNLDFQTRGFTASQKQLYQQHYGDLYRNYQFMLGQALDAEQGTVLNQTGKADYDGEPLENLGEASVEALRKLVKQQVDSFTLRDYFREVAEQDPTKSTALEVVTETNPLESDEQQQAREEAPESADFDKSTHEHNRLDGLSTLMRRFFSLIEVVDADPRTGFTTGRMVDGAQVFNTLMKVTSDAEPHRIVAAVRALIAQYRYDGDELSARTYETVFGEFADFVGLDSNDLPTQNHQIYSQFIDAFHGTEMEYLVNTVRLKENKKEDPDEETTYRVSSEIKDSIVKQDLLQKKLSLNAGLERAYNQYLSQVEAGGKDEAFEAALRQVEKLAKQVQRSEQKNPLLSGSVEQELESLTNGLQQALATIGLRLPKSLLRLSLLAIDQTENNSPLRLKPDSAAAQHYQAHQEFVRDGKYLQKSFFDTLRRITPLMLARTSATEVMRYVGSENEKFDSSATGKLANAYNAVLTRASYYLVRYDPEGLQSTTRNGEGKPIYRYVKYTPIATMCQDIRHNGLGSHLSKDPYYAKYLSSFYHDNPLVAAATGDSLSRDAHEARLFFDNLRVASWGAIKQTVGEQQRAGVSYGSASLSDLLVNQLNFFQHRQVQSRQVVVVDPKTGDRRSETVSVTTYNRTLTQLEASSSNYLVTARYRPHVGPTGNLITYQGQPLIVQTLEGITAQEFNRMRREWRDRDQRKADLLAGEGGEARGINAYNAKGTTSNPVTDDKSLRAYQFNLLPDFFKASPLTQQLQQAALDGTDSFEQVLKSELGRKLRKALGEYAEQQYQKHLSSLEGNGVISRRTLPDFLFAHDLDPTIQVEQYVPADETTDPSLVYTLEDGTPVRLKSTKQKVRVKAPLLSERLSYEGATSNQKLSDAYGPDQDGSNYLSLIRDAYFNFWENSLLVNQVFDGDVALSVKNAVDYFKRNKAWLAAGSTFKEGFFSVASLPKLLVVVDPDNLEAGQYDSVDELREQLQDARLQGDEFRTELLEKSLANVERLLAGNKDEAGSVYKDVFDGQSFATHFHQLDMYQSLGRLGFGQVGGKQVALLDLCLAKTYRSLTREETQVLEDAGIVHNSKKTVTTSRLDYLKLSEHLLDRADVSLLLTEKVYGQEGYEQEVTRKYEELHELTWQAYQLRQQRSRLHADFMRTPAGVPDPGKVAGSQEVLTDLQQVMSQIHSYFTAAPNRGILHGLLNSMEYHQTDMLLDLNASKKLTVLPVSLQDRSVVEITLPSGSVRAQRYVNLPKSTTHVDARYKYLQVETSGVHDVVKMGVQAKVLLMADLQQLSDQILRDEHATPLERQAAQDLPDLVLRYQNTLAGLTQSKLDQLQKFLRDPDGNFDVGDVFTLIRQSLLEQGADSNKLQWFELGADGKPKYGTNMPQVRKMLEYYFFSIYSNNVTDEKGQGFKNFHVTSFGYKLLYDRATGEVISQKRIRQNPRQYLDKARYGSRYPGVGREVDPKTKQPRYFVEVLMPEPFFESKGHEQFWRENQSEMFGTRIPTEDKRSMLALKVVDFIDASYRNSIIVPQIVHLLSGSDLDIDSLYGQRFNVYKDWLLHRDLLTHEGSQGKYRKYGEYGALTGRPKQVRQFLEYFTYITQAGDLASAVRQQKQALSQLPTLGYLSPETYDILELLGYDQTDLENISLQPPAARELLQDLRDETEERELLSDEQFRQYRKQKFVARGFTSQEIGSIVADFDTTQLREQAEDERVTTARYEYQQALRLNQRYRMALRLEASVRALRQNSTLPVTLTDFLASPVPASLISPLWQNQNLQAKLDVLTNEAVFRRLYVNEQQSTARFVRILEHLGVNATDIANRFNQYTVDGVLNVRGLNSMNKNGIAITANLNKFLGIASQYGLVLKPENILWNVNGKPYGHYGDFDEEGTRAIALIGNMLGIFADGAKDPIPGALQLNEVNAHVTLSMIGLGIPAEAAIYLNFLPEVKRAVQRVQDAEKALSEGNRAEGGRLQLHSELGEVLGGEFFRTPREGGLGYTENGAQVAAFNELKASSLLKEGRDKYLNFSVDPAKVKIAFQVPEKSRMFNVQNEARMRQILPTEMGYTVSVAQNPSTVLSPLAQKIVLLDLYRQQAMQGNKLKRVSKLVGLYKRLNPSFQSVDSIIEAATELATGELSVFTNSEQLFAQGQVFHVLRDMLQDLDGQSRLLFLERTRSMGPLVQLLGSLYQDKSQLSQDVVRFMGLRLLQRFHNEGNENPAAQADRQNLLSFGQVETWLNLSVAPDAITTTTEDLALLAEKYPNLKLLSFYRVRETERLASLKTADGKTLPKRGQVYLEQLNKGKTHGEFAEQLIDDHRVLLRDADPKIRRLARKLVFAELFRGGLTSAPGSALNSLDQGVLRQTATYVERFASLLQQSEASPEAFTEKLASLLGMERASDVPQLLDELLVQLSYQALKSGDSSRGVQYVRPLKLALTGKEDESPLVQTIPQSLSPSERKTELLKALQHFYHWDQETAYKTHRDSARQFQPLKKLKLGDVLTVSPVGGDVNQGTLELLGRSLGIRQVVLEGERVEYQFPFVLEPQNGAHYLRLTHLDGVPVGVLLARAMSSPLSSLEELPATPEQVWNSKPRVELLGHEATYEVLPAQLGTDVVSPLGFSVAEATRLAQVSSGKLPLLVAAGTPITPTAGRQTPLTRALPVTLASGKTYLLQRDEAGALHVHEQSSGTEITPKQPAYASIVEAYQQVYLEDFRKGKTVDLSEVDNEHDYYELLSEQSENPMEVAQAWLSVEPGELSPADTLLKENLRKTTEASFRRFSDYNLVKGKGEQAFRRAYLNSAGQPLDTQAEELGLEPEQVVDFMLRYPQGPQSATAENPYQTKLAQRFEQLTGFPITEDFAQRLVSNEPQQLLNRGQVSALVDQLLSENLRQKLESKNHQLQVGRLVKYVQKGVIKDFLITSQDETTGLYQLRDPRAGAQLKVISGIKGDKLVPTKHLAQRVYYAAAWYLVLPSGLVVAEQGPTAAKFNEATNGDRQKLLAVVQGVANFDLADRYVAMHYFRLSAAFRLSGGTSEAFARFQREAQRLVTGLTGQSLDGRRVEPGFVADKLSCLQ